MYPRSAGRAPPSYEKYSGSPLVKESETPSAAQKARRIFGYRFALQSCPKESRSNHPMKGPEVFAAGDSDREVVWVLSR